MRLLAVLTVFLLSVSAAHADYRSEYTAYGQALAAGDYAKAARHGEAAWRAAEKELGDSKATAILAFNYAELVVIYAPSKAVEPYARARAISAKMETGLIPEDIESGAAYAAFVLAPTDKELAKALVSALNSRVAKKLPASPVSAYGWLALCKREARESDTQGALAYADRALADAQAMGDPVDPVLMRNALVYAGIYRIAVRSRDEKSVGEAVRYLEQSFNLFPPQESIDAFDPLLARAIMWRATASALAVSTEGPRAETGSRIETGEDLETAIEQNSRFDAASRVRWKSAGGILCQRIEWASNPAPKFPRDARTNGQVGATVIGFEMAGDKVKRAVVLADMFESGFGAAAVKAIETWVAKTPVPPGCGRNELLVVRYTLI